ncbi:hypothetical protein DM860_007102 [Cuscuta australis]|uniref:Uncharacterized protein n=1 Tax=Cuscuta australis TaxID=267555 RepID=A0A328E789_9ASTE|nr:hypothetical protein DM860_007102 [Cuscuta australis]
MLIENRFPPESEQHGPQQVASPRHHGMKLREQITRFLTALSAAIFFHFALHRRSPPLDQQQSRRSFVSHFPLLPQPEFNS